MRNGSDRNRWSEFAALFGNGRMYDPRLLDFYLTISLVGVPGALLFVSAYYVIREFYPVHLFSLTTSEAGIASGVLGYLTIQILAYTRVYRTFLRKQKRDIGFPLFHLIAMIGAWLMLVFGVVFIELVSRAPR